MKRVIIGLMPFAFLCAQSTTPVFVKRVAAPIELVSPGKPLPKLLGTQLVSFDYRIFAPGPNIRVWDTRDLSSTSFTLWPKGSSELMINDIAASGSALITAAWGRDNTGQRHAGLYLIGKDGATRQIADTGEYIPQRLAIGTPDDFWTFGSQFRDKDSQMEIFNCVRHYSMSGEKMGEYLPRSTFPDHGEPGQNLGGQYGNSQIIVTASGGVAVYNASTEEWIELDSSGAIIGRQSLQLPAANSPQLGPRMMVQSGKRTLVSRGGGGSIFSYDSKTAAPSQIFAGGIGTLIGEDAGLLVFAHIAPGGGFLEWWRFD